MQPNNATVPAHFDLRPAARQRPSFWVALVGSVDALLRAHYGVYEFTDDPECVFRIGMDLSAKRVTLGDGTEIDPGEPVGILHFWNEHLQRYADEGPELGWASDMRRRVTLSLRLLADYVQREPGWRTVRVFGGSAMLSRRLGNAQIGRVAERFGFERIEPEQTVRRQLHFLGDCCNAWALTRAFNPGALTRQQFLRTNCELWITRDVLLRRYAGRGSRGRLGMR